MSGLLFPQGWRLGNALQKCLRGVVFHKRLLLLTVVPITAPQENPEDFCSRKGLYSMNMQSLVDADGRFCNMQVNMPDRPHDAKAWDLSDAKRLVEHHFSRSDYVFEVKGRRIKPYV
jgi:hypothetical protein